MSTPIETIKNDAPYWQAIGVLRGELQSYLPAKGKNQIFSLLYHGREYPVLPSKSRFEQQKDFDLSKERLYLVYPRPRAQKAYHLLNRDYGQARAKLLNFVPNGIGALYERGSWSRDYINEKAPQMMARDNLTRLFDVAHRLPKMEDSRLAYSVFKLLKGVLHQKNELANAEEKKIARQTLSLLNRALCDQLYHPESDDPASAFLRGWIQSSCLNTELDRWAKGMLFDTMSFVLVGYSDTEGSEYLDKDGNPLEQPMGDGDFILSGHWQRWQGAPLLDNQHRPLLDFNGRLVYDSPEGRPTKATFTSHLNKKVGRDFKRTPLGAEDPKRLIIFLNREEPEIVDKCYGRAIAKFSPRLNIFNLRDFVETEAIAAPLTAKNLVAQKATKPSKDRKPSPKMPKTKTI